MKGFVVPHTRGAGRPREVVEKETDAARGEVGASLVSSS